jgi:non-homologous end joining protein Ku
LLAKAMERAHMGAVARFSTRGKQRLVLRQTKGGIMMHALLRRQVRAFDEIDLTKAQTSRQ